MHSTLFAAFRGSRWAAALVFGLATFSSIALSQGVVPLPGPGLTPILLPPLTPLPPPVSPPQVVTPIAVDPWNPAAGKYDFTRARATAQNARLINVSIRAKAGTGADTLIAGGAVQGAGLLPVLVRAIGPGLGRFGVTNYLGDPQIQVYRGTTVAAAANALSPLARAASDYVGAFPALEHPNDGTDAALLGEIGAGTLTVHCTSRRNAAGVALLEFYDAASEPAAGAARFANLSARARVEAGEGVVVLGFVIAGEGNLTLLLRGIGASLADFGVGGTLADPKIELYSGPTRLAANDDWRSGDVAAVADAQLAVNAFALGSPKDAALVATLPAGAYTLVVSGVGGASGVALAEIHEVVPADFDAARSTNAVGLELFRELAKSRGPENLVISPYSIESALALAYAGADGGTRTEMARVLHLTDDNGALQVAFAALRRGMEAAAEASKPIAAARTAAGQRTDAIEWNAANRLFGQRDYAFRESFLTLMADGFAAPFETLDFIRNAEGNRRYINEWVEAQTRQRIRNLIPEGALDAATRLVLVNAIYLKSPWNMPFDKALTVPRPFFFTPDTTRDVPTMQQTTNMGYAVEDGVTVVTRDYLGGELQFVVAVPPLGTYPEAIAARLTPADFARWAKLRETSTRLVALSLPKFKVEGGTVPLGVALRRLGMNTAFDLPQGSANFDRIAPRRPDDYLYISNVFHQTFVAVDEEGTEAAAATAVVMATTTSAAVPAPVPVVVRVDRPFLFAIQHRASGTCLFLGAIRNP